MEIGGDGGGPPLPLMDGGPPLGGSGPFGGGPDGPPLGGGVRVLVGGSRMTVLRERRVRGGKG